jgi:hypothetical protein
MLKVENKKYMNKKKLNLILLNYLIKIIEKLYKIDFNLEHNGIIVKHQTT